MLMVGWRVLRLPKCKAKRSDFLIPTLDRTGRAYLGLLGQLTDYLLECLSISFEVDLPKRNYKL